MKIFRVFLVAQTLVISAYMYAVGERHGWSFFPTFVGDIVRISWPGQFNLDFTLVLSICAIWVFWRNRNSNVRYLLAVAMLLGGILFLAPYLIYLSYKCRGDVQKIVAG